MKKKRGGGRDSRPELYPLAVFSNQIHRKWLCALLLALVWMKTRSLCCFSKKELEGRPDQQCKPYHRVDYSKEDNKEGKSSGQVMQPKAGKNILWVHKWAPRQAELLLNPQPRDGTLHSTSSQSMAYRDLAGTQSWASGALVWKWQQGGDSYDSGADSSPS